MDLSIVIPARNEMFLPRTLQDLLEHSHGSTEIITVLDGWKCDDPILEDPRITTIRLCESIGQRAATNMGVRIAKGTYIMKVDAHCSFADNFDQVIIQDIQPEWTMAPTMRNLHAFNWVCTEGHQVYQGPEGPCRWPEKDGVPACGAPTHMEMIWRARNTPSRFFRFDSTLHFQYWGSLGARPGFRGRLAENMSLQGSCFVISKKRYEELNICDEAHGSWGQQGTEVACKSWLSGGKVINTNKTWYAHLFRTRPGFSFPYSLSDRDVNKARDYSRWLFKEGHWCGLQRPLWWLLKRFWPVPGWTEEEVDKLPR